MNRYVVDLKQTMNNKMTGVCVHRGKASRSRTLCKREVYWGGTLSSAEAFLLFWLAK